MAKCIFIPTDWNNKRIASLLKTSLVIANKLVFSPRVFEYWQRYCKAEWDGRYNVKVEAASNRTAIINYCNSRLYVCIDLITEDGGCRVKPIVTTVEKWGL